MALYGPSSALAQEPELLNVSVAAQPPENCLKRCALQSVLKYWSGL